MSDMKTGGKLTIAAAREPGGVPGRCRARAPGNPAHRLERDEGMVLRDRPPAIRPSPVP